MALIGIDLGGTQLRVAVADDRGRLKTVMRHPTQAGRGRRHVIDRIVATVKEALQENGTSPGRVRALGIGLPGPVDPAAGLVISPANLPGFKNVPLNRILTRATGIPSFLHHDAHLAALGEHQRGAARGAREVVYVTVSTGIGAGLILRGELYAGAHGIAGEVGHIVVQPNGPLCTCGNRGCVEAIASGTGIARAAREQAPRIPGSALHGLDNPTAEDVARAARAGDPLANAILETAGSYLGVAMGTLVNLFNPQLIVLGGSVLKAAAPRGVHPPVVFERFGTAPLARDPGHALEFVSSRVERYDPSSRKPQVSPGTLKDDVMRRDFTVNSLLMEWDGTVLDLTGRGLDDLKSRRIVTPLEPKTTFDEDPLRMLRAVRFATTLRFTLDPAVEAAIRDQAGRLQPPTVSMERIRDEFSKLLLAEQVEAGLQMLDATRLLPRILPQLEAGKGILPGCRHSHDVFRYGLVAAPLAPPALVARPAALLPDA